MSVETPDMYKPVELTARLPMASTRLLVRPPWRVARRLTWCDWTSIEASTLPGVAERTRMCPNALASWPLLAMKACQTFLVKAVQADMG